MATAKKLTQKDVDAAKASAKEYTMWDWVVPGFGMRVRPSGTRSFVYVYRRHSRKTVQRCTIGKPGALTLDEARRQAKQLAAEVTIGNDPAAVKAERRTITLAAVYSEYEQCNFRRFSPGYQKSVRRVFRSEIIPTLGSVPITMIARADIREITSRITARGARVAANNVHRVASSFFSWCVDQELLTANPLSGAKLGTYE